MRNYIVAGNWKMNTTSDEGAALAQELCGIIPPLPENIQVILAPPFTHLSEVAQIVKGKKINVAAQNCHSESAGAFTGEISAVMIKSSGAEYVIIGHSERRSLFHEDNKVLNKKVRTVIGSGLIPIFCCGENLEQRKSNSHFEVIEQQLGESLFELNEGEFGKIVIAYEPVWAIGTGVQATPEQAQEMHSHIRRIINNRFSRVIAEQTTLLYGGSCNSGNAAGLFSQPDVDGGLIGGASLKAKEFAEIVRILHNIKKVE